MLRISAFLVLAACGAAPLAQGDHTLVAGGHTLAYHVHGHGPYAIVHSGGPGIEWSYNRMASVEAHLTLIYLEPIGTGGSARLADRKEYTLKRYAEELEGFRAALGLDHVYLIGHSFGGFVAQLYAIAHPDRLAGLILYDTAPRLGADFGASAEKHAGEFFADRAWFADATAALGEEDNVQTDDAFRAVLGRELPLYFADWDGHAEAYRRHFADVRAWADPLHGGSSGPFDTRAALAGLRVPTLVLVGRRDFICAVPFAEEMHAAIPGSSLVVLEHSGHMGALEEPEAFAAAIAAFVGGR
jgi:pimeloyl-ACP methyl ester carboxylesterase